MNCTKIRETAWAAFGLADVSEFELPDAAETSEGMEAMVSKYFVGTEHLGDG